MCHHCALLVNDDTRLNGHAAMGTPVVVTYAFASEGDLPQNGYTTADNTLVASVRAAVAVAERTAGLRFVEVEDSADEMMTFYYNNDTEGWSWAYFPQVSEGHPNTSGAIAMNRFYGDYSPGSGGFQVLLHEIGHAMGLKHPHDGTPRLPGRLDNTDHTIMSYNWRGADKAEYQHLDVAALEALYGAAAGLDGISLKWNGAADVLTMEGTRRADVLIGVNDASLVIGRGGNDRLIGRMSDDTLRGNGGSDTLRGFDGEDHLAGGKRGDRLIGGLDDDRLLGNAGHDRLHGEAGADFMRAGRGEDVLGGGPGADTLLGDGGADRIWGAAGADRIIGGPGPDTLSGGAGGDTFVLRPHHGGDWISDFNRYEGDTLNLRPFDITREDALGGLSQRGDHMILEIGGTTVMLAHNGSTSFSGEDFIV